MREPTKLQRHVAWCIDRPEDDVQHGPDDHGEWYEADAVDRVFNGLMLECATLQFELREAEEEVTRLKVCEINPKDEVIAELMQQIREDAAEVERLKALNARIMEYRVADSAHLNAEINRAQNHLPRDSAYWDEWNGDGSETERGEQLLADAALGANLRRLVESGSERTVRIELVNCLFMAYVEEMCANIIQPAIADTLDAALASALALLDG